MSEFVGNVFVVSRLGQIRNVQNFIKQHECKKNILIIQYSQADSDILRNMIKICNQDLYLEDIYLKLPKNPLVATRKKNIKMYNKIAGILEYVKTNYEFNNLFLCNADKWYSYYEKVKNEFNYDYTINLLEEGLTTYIVSSDETYQDYVIKPIVAKDIKKRYKRVIKRFKEIIKSLKMFFITVVALILDCISFIFRVNIAKSLHKLYLNIVLKDKYKFSYVKHFDNAYVCFPEKLKQVNFKIDKVNKLDFTFNELDKEKFKNEFNEDYALFINQKYVNYKDHFNILFKILTEMGIDKIYIKTHPKENKEKVIDEINECLEKYENLHVEIIQGADGVPIEDIIYNFKFKTIIGITSSSLLYCNNFIKDANIVSIATRYRDLCLESDVNKQEMILFEKEYKNFINISNVKQFEIKQER